MTETNAARQRNVGAAAPSVLVTEVADGVRQIRMQDRQSRNTFSDALCDGLADAFAEVGADAGCRAVVLTGYDSYFASGGTQASLLSLAEGRGRFSDRDLYSLALDCPVPVVAAMQGHGVGGGFVIGLFCDVVVMSRESLYTTNFMKYGFTPGMGATLIVPLKLGPALGDEMLLTAASFRGEDLRRRGVPFAVLPRAEVLERALETAIGIAEAPRLSLVTLKSHLVAETRRRLAGVVRQELAMHELTFAQPEVADRVRRLFGS